MADPLLQTVIGAALGAAYSFIPAYVGFCRESFRKGRPAREVISLLPLIIVQYTPIYE